MGRLRLYTHANGSTALHEGGFSWLAALALPVWALQRRLHALAAGAFLASLAPGTLGLLLGLPQWGSMALSAAWLVACGIGAAPLHAWWLHRRGWVLTAEEPAPRTGPSA